MGLLAVVFYRDELVQGVVGVAGDLAVVFAAGLADAVAAGVVVELGVRKKLQAITGGWITGYRVAGGCVGCGGFSRRLPAGSWIKCSGLGPWTRCRRSRAS